MWCNIASYGKWSTYMCIYTYIYIYIHTCNILYLIYIYICLNALRYVLYHGKKVGQTEPWIHLCYWNLARTWLECRGIPANGGKMWEWEESSRHSNRQIGQHRCRSTEVHQQITCRGFDQLCYFPVEGEDMQRLKTQGHYLGKFLGWHGSPQWFSKVGWFQVKIQTWIIHSNDISGIFPKKILDDSNGANGSNGSHQTHQPITEPLIWTAGHCSTTRHVFGWFPWGRSWDGKVSIDTSLGFSFSSLVRYCFHNCVIAPVTTNDNSVTSDPNDQDQLWRWWGDPVPLQPWKPGWRRTKTSDYFGMVTSCVTVFFFQGLRVILIQRTETKTTCMPVCWFLSCACNSTCIASKPSWLPAEAPIRMQYHWFVSQILYCFYFR